MAPFTWTDEYGTFSVVLDGDVAVVTTEATPHGEHLMGFCSGVVRVPLHNLGDLLVPRSIIEEILAAAAK